VLGLVLTALSAAPGIVGAFARGTGRLLLPATARRAAALALGVGLAVGSPALSACSTAAEPPAAGAAGAGPAAAIESLPLAGPVPDWPTGQPPTAQPPSPPSPAATVPTPPLTTPVPDWPSGDHPAGQQPPGALPASEHVVVRGDCLWDIAAADLRTRTGGEPAAPDVARVAEAWWRANAGVIGSDPDLLLPGQVLRAPAAPPVPLESETPR
jgi:nucleoid-associated protein YgaU